MSLKTLESDADLAFSLQLQEAINASLSLNPSTSSSSNPLRRSPPFVTQNDSVLNFKDEELSKLDLQTKDRKLSLQEDQRVPNDLHRRIHDPKFASEILLIPEDEWEDSGDDYSIPYYDYNFNYNEGETSSGGGCLGSARDTHEVFGVYFKGLVSEEEVAGDNINNNNNNKKVVLAGIGIAICDSRDVLIFEKRKSLDNGGNFNRRVVELKGLIEGLNAALDLGLKRVNFYVDNHSLFQHVIGRWKPKQRKIATLVNQVFRLRAKFEHCYASFVARHAIKYAFKLARDAIESQITGTAESDVVKIDSRVVKNLKETCVICLEETDVSQIFPVDGCQHRYCFSCMKQHVEAKLLHGLLPKCPHEACKSELNIDSCRKFLTPKLIGIMSQRIKEASIPVTEKVYCPYPRCSALMSKSEVTERSKNLLRPSGQNNCMKCRRLFCIFCKVPWHNNISCSQYRKSNPYPREEDAKLKSLANTNRWRQCQKCNHMIELDQGCYHMTCRCGHEFCYTCGAERKNKKATCSCPLWDEENILDGSDDLDDDWEDDYYDSEDYEDEDEESYDSEDEVEYL